jgi:hypothetical protein
MQRLVDRFGRHPHLRIVRELAAQPTDDLLGRIAPAEIFLHHAAQLQVDRELGRLGPARAHTPARAPSSHDTRRSAQRCATARLIVDGWRPSRPAIDRIDSPPARAAAISSRSENVKHRPFRSRPRRGRTPPPSPNKGPPAAPPSTPDTAARSGSATPVGGIGYAGRVTRSRPSNARSPRTSTTARWPRPDSTSIRCCACSYTHARGAYVGSRSSSS